MHTYVCVCVLGNLGVARSFVGDITDSTNQARAMSYISLIVSIGITGTNVTLYYCCLSRKSLVAVCV